MKKWELTRLTFQIVSKGVLSNKVIPKITALAEDGNILVYEGDEATNVLNQLGQDGWELVSVTAPSGHAIRGGVSDHEILWFKRPKE